MAVLQDRSAGHSPTLRNACPLWATVPCHRAVVPIPTARRVTPAPTVPAKQHVKAIRIAQRNGAASINSAIHRLLVAMMQAVAMAPSVKPAAAFQAVLTTTTVRWAKPVKKAAANRAAIATPTAPWTAPAKPANASMKSVWATNARWPAKSIYFVVQDDIVTAPRGCAVTACLAAYVSRAIK